MADPDGTPGRADGGAQSRAADATTSVLVSHYLDHIQPAIDELAAADCHLFSGLDPEALPEECSEGSEHDLRRMDAFVRFRERVTREVDAWCGAQGVSDDALREALAAASVEAAAGKETNGTILLELLAAVEDYGTFAGYMAGEAESAQAAQEN